VSAEPQFVPFTDVDTVQLPPASVTSEVADVLRRVAAKCTTLVLWSTKIKTPAELDLIQQGLGLHHPLICESAAAVFAPTGYCDCDPSTARVATGYEVGEFNRPCADVLGVLSHRPPPRHRDHRLST
jgi:predicted mannosyl-3-phosphoglycerate phosphatase (HAD superfamily)